ncbi:hypothetical protein KJ942_05205 [bacterium]|nr:hypothetical protein [bacterium]
MKKNELSSLFLRIILVALAVSPAIGIGEGDRNLFLIGMMTISPIILIINRKFYRSDILIILFLVSIVLIPILYQPASMRWSTVMYSWMFGMTFVAYKQLLYKNYYSLEDYQKLLKLLIYAYFLVLLVQQFCVLTGLPIFNVSNYYPPEPWKLNSLSAEPSHSARIVALLMYSYIVVKELGSEKKYDFRLNFKEDKWVWLGFLWTMLTMGSGTAFIFLLIVLSKFIRAKNLFALFVLFLIIVLFVNLMEISAFERMFKFLLSVFTLDIQTMITTDHSASIRIVPQIIVATMVDINTLDGWFGHGIDYTSTFLSNIMPGLQEGASGGGMFQVWVEYGFLSFIIFLIFSFFASYKKDEYITIVFWFLLVFMYGVNNQIVWLSITLLYTNKYFESKQIKSS